MTTSTRTTTTGTETTSTATTRTATTGTATTRTTTIRQAASAMAAGALAAGIAVAAAPAAGAVTNPARDVPMPYPYGGTHVMRFGAMTFCHTPNGSERGPRLQAMSANAIDLNGYQTVNPFDVNQYVPFNAITVKWRNNATKASGVVSNTSQGREVDVYRILTGGGDLTVTITVSRSAVPILDAGSVAPGVSATRTVTLNVGKQPRGCDG